HLLEQMQVPPGAISDSFAITFRYKHDGNVVEFDAEHFPEDFDSTYEYVDRYDKLVRRGNAIPKITDFSLKTVDGLDQTEELLGSSEQYVLVLFKTFDLLKQDPASLDPVVSSAHAAGFRVLVATPLADEAAKYIKRAD